MCIVRRQFGRISKNYSAFIGVFIRGGEEAVSLGRGGGQFHWGGGGGVRIFETIYIAIELYHNTKR